MLFRHPHQVTLQTTTPLQDVVNDPRLQQTILIRRRLPVHRETVPPDSERRINNDPIKLLIRATVTVNRGRIHTYLHRHFGHGKTGRDPFNYLTSHAVVIED